MTCLRCNRAVSTLDGHCTPCRRHLGLEPRKRPRPKPPAPKAEKPRKEHHYVSRKNNPTRAEVRKAYEASLAEMAPVEKQKPSLARVKWAERPVPRIVP